MATTLPPNSFNWIFKPSLLPDVLSAVSHFGSSSLLPDRCLQGPPQLPVTFHIPFCLVAFAGAIVSASCPAHSSQDPSPSTNLLLAVPTGVSPPWAVVALQVCMSGRGDFGLITTSFGTSKPGHREELEPGV